MKINSVNLAEKSVISHTDSSGKKPFRLREILLISGGHAMHDTYTGFLPPVLPLLIEKLSLLKTEAGLLAIALQLPSLLQPFIGHLADRKNLKLVVMGGPAVAAILLTMLGVIPYYGVLVILLLIAGLNSAAFHAIAPVVIGRMAHNRLGRAMGIWMVGGEIGRMIAPMIIVSFISVFSISKMPLLMILGLLVSGILFVALRNITTRETTESLQSYAKLPIREIMRFLLPLSGIIFVRSFTVVALTIYLPTFLVEAGENLMFAGASLTIYEAAGIVGAFWGGSISDRFQRWKIILWALAIAAILMGVFLGTSGWWRLPILILLGIALLSLTPVIMAMVQENFPKNRSLANGLYMSVSFGIRSLVILTMGILGDVIGLKTTYLVAPALLLVGIPLTILFHRQEQLIRTQNLK